MTAALARIEQESGDLIRRIASAKPAKELARSTGLTPRHIFNLRDGDCQPRWLSFIALAQESPELRAAVARWLGLAPGPEAIEARRLIEAALAALPQAGDRENG